MPSARLGLTTHLTTQTKLAGGIAARLRSLPRAAVPERVLPRGRGEALARAFLESPEAEGLERTWPVVSHLIDCGCDTGTETAALEPRPSLSSLKPPARVAEDIQAAAHAAYGLEQVGTTPPTTKMAAARAPAPGAVGDAPSAAGPGVGAGGVVRRVRHEPRPVRGAGPPGGDAGVRRSSRDAWGSGSLLFG